MVADARVESSLGDKAGLGLDRWWPLLKSCPAPLCGPERLVLWWVNRAGHGLLQGHGTSGWQTRQCIRTLRVLYASSLRLHYDHSSDPVFWFPASGSRIAKGHLLYNLEATADPGDTQNTFSKTHAFTTSISLVHSTNELTCLKTNGKTSHRKKKGLEGNVATC